ncbi:hypothetical protein RBH20_18165 [Haloarcula sp. H-GB4]|uniref:hypothetical protein n=1 Tax=Haloarcula sp. H-GB4 TaxID=3069755 RepID=UPI0027AF03F7|nr:hypothetical protein [Haloarcula sp. H-GB4]MDQ2074460.1 hypothetical protein [Haloarcula sp. H-GB4]
MSEVREGPRPARRNGRGSRVRSCILDSVDIEADDPPSFLSERVQFCLGRVTDEDSEPSPDGVATTEPIRDGTDDVVEAMKAPDDT